jgi:hypothetical protein
MTIRNFIDQLANGENSAAKETLETILSTKSFEALDQHKREIAGNVFGGTQEQTEEQ